MLTLNVLQLQKATELASTIFALERGLDKGTPDRLYHMRTTVEMGGVPLEIPESVIRASAQAAIKGCHLALNEIGIELEPLNFHFVMPMAESL